MGGREQRDEELGKGGIGRPQLDDIGETQRLALFVVAKGRTLHVAR